MSASNRVFDVVSRVEIVGIGHSPGSDPDDL